MIESQPPPAGDLVQPIPLASPVDPAGLDTWVLRYARRVESWPAVMPWWRALIELFALLVIVLFAGFVCGMALAPFVKDMRWFSLIATMIVGGVAIVASLIMVHLNGHSPASIGLTTRNLPLEFLLGVGALILAYGLTVSLMISLSLLVPEVMERQNDASEAILETFPPLSFEGLVLMSLGVALWEEIVFRGFLLTRLRCLLGRWWIALPVSVLLFAVPHLYQGPLAMGIISIQAMVMGALFIWRRSLAAPIAFHFVFDLTMFSIIRAVSPDWS